MNIIGIRWTAQDDTSFKVGMSGWQDGRTVTVPLAPGMHVSWRISGPRLCVGYRGVDGTMHPCPEGRRALLSSPQCGPCMASDISSPCAKCDGSRCSAQPARRASCIQREHVLYVAVFGHGLVKVGVSSSRRVRTRWAEQGADYAAVLATYDSGMAARRVEARLGRSPGLSTRVTTKYKASHLHPLPPDRAMQTVAALRPLLRAHGLTLPDLLEDMSQHYGLRQLGPHVSCELLRVDRDHRSIDVVGEVVGVKGPILVIRRGALLYGLSVPSVAGLHLIEDTRIIPETQTQLTDF